MIAVSPQLESLGGEMHFDLENAQDYLGMSCLLLKLLVGMTFCVSFFRLGLDEQPEIYIFLLVPNVSAMKADSKSISSSRNRLIPSPALISLEDRLE